MALQEEWSLTLAQQPIFWCISLLSICLVIASFPHHLTRWPALSILLVPATGAFRTAQDLSPDDTLNDIYLRFVIILVSHTIYTCFRDAQSCEVSLLLLLKMR
jgi:uncharacterized membrane protein YoaT (DUF817 family)